MSRSKRPTYLQKPKRIRKNKKDFLRGSIQRTPVKPAPENAMVPIQYVLLFFLFTATVIGYVSLTFLVSKIHINGTIYNQARVSLPTIHFPSIYIPQLTIPTPRIIIPGIDISPLTKPIEDIAARSVALLLQYSNPLPYWTNVFETASQALWISMVWIVLHINHIRVQFMNTLQTNGTALFQSIHPIEILQHIVSSIAEITISMSVRIENGSIWVGKTGVDYITLLGDLFSAAGRWLLSSSVTIGTILLEAIRISIVALFNVTLQQIASFYQNCFFAMAMSDTFIKNFQFETNTILLSITLVMWHGVSTGVLYIIQGMTLLFHGMIFVLESILSIVIHIGIAIANWCMSILTAIKKWLDTTIGGIGALIHLGDPLYTVIGESISNLLSGMGEAFSMTAKAIQGGKLE